MLVRHEPCSILGAIRQEKKAENSLLPARMNKKRNGKLVGKLLTIQHRLNPLHLHCRFLDKGLNKKLSTSICRSYEIIIFLGLNCVIKSVMYFYCFVNRKYRVLEELRKK